MNTNEVKAVVEALSDDSKALFFAYLDDAGNWGDCPIWDCNIACGHTENGFLTDWKKKGLVMTDQTERPNGLAGYDAVVVFSDGVKRAYPEYFSYVPEEVEKF